MSEDRLDEINHRLTELEATVRGLTHELVEANDRIQKLEGQLKETEAEASNKHLSRESDRTISDGSGDQEPDREKIGDDIIVA